MLYGPRVTSPFATLALRSPLRPSQVAAIEAFEADRAAGRTSTHLVAPPGSGKTVVGLEIVRRIGRPALVLAPTATIQAQWSDKLALFCDDPAAHSGPEGPLHVLTYQAICQTADPGGALRDAARERLAEQRAKATGTPAVEVRAEIAAFTGAARERFEREVAREVARLKRAVAKGHDVDVHLAELIAPAARERVDALLGHGVGTVVLDECHHLASLWGYLVRAALAVLGDHVHVVGLTATSPAELAGDEADLYAELLGPVDFEIATPAVVRDGHLAPYQELACFATPLASERGWLAERHVRFGDLLDRLHDPPAPDEEELAFGPWVIGRVRYRDSGDGAARVAFATLAAKRPELARAGLRYLHDAGQELPDDAPRGEGWREPPTLEDWLVLIGDYAVGCLRSHPGEAAERRFADLQTALRDLGFNLTRQGVRRGGSEVDRVLTSSAAKPLAAIEVLAAEAENRGEGLRALALCDSEHGERQPEGSPLALAGGARGVLRALGEDLRTETLRPLLVTARTLACLPGQAPGLAAALGATEIEQAGGLALLHAPGWESRDRVARAGEALAGATTQLLVGTRGLLGEGWDAPRLNVLVDLTTVAADVSVRQMRGRSLRLDPAAPDKLASNWDVVCVAPDLARGSADYARFARRHAHLHAPCEDGSIETGVSHVHPALSPYQPPAEAELAELNASALRRAADRGGARERWRLGEPYRGEDVPVLLVRREVGASTEATGVAVRRDAGASTEATGVPVRRDAGASTEATGVALAPGPPPALPKPHGPSLGLRTKAARAAYPAVLALDRVAQAVAAAYAALGEIRREAAASLVLTPRPGGMLRCVLMDGDVRENALFAAALDEAISPALGQRYVVSRPLWPAGRARRTVAWRALTFRAALEESWHAVPSDLGAHKERAEAYHAAWAAHLGPGELLFAGREGAAGRDRLAGAAAARPDYVTSRRVLWH